MTAAVDVFAGPIIPVVVLADVAHAVPLARALVRGGVRTVEVTLRSPAGLPAIERIAAEVPEAYVGAGTVTTVEQGHAAARAGASFLVTPGSPERLLEGLLETGVPVLPGASTASEIMRLLDFGITLQKFFPAAASGGPAFLRAIGGPLPHVRFCPTGGISADNAAEYLAIDNVACVGGSWLSPPHSMASGDWGLIERLATEAASLRL